MPKVTDPRLLSRLNGPQMVAPNPMFPGQLQGQGLNNEGQGLTNEERRRTLPYAAPKAAAQTREAQVNAGVAAATAPAEVRQKGAAATKAEVDARTAQANLDTTGGAGTEQAKSASFYTRATRANQAYDKGRFDANGAGVPTMGREAAQAVFPHSWVNRFTSSNRQQAESLQREFIASTLRYESGAAISDQEFKRQRDLFFPVPNDSPEEIALKAQLRQNAIDGLRVASGPAAPMLDASNPLQQPASANGPEVGVATGGILGPQSKTEFDPQTSAAVDRLIRMGRPVGEIIAFAKSRGFTDIDTPALAQAIQYANDPRNAAYKGGFTQATRTKPTTLGEQVAGSPLGAFGSALGSAATLGFNDELAGGLNALEGGSYAEGRDAFNASKHLLSDAHPVADFAGTALGSIAPFLAAGKLVNASGLGAKLTPAARYEQTAQQAAQTGATRASVLGDVVTGGAYGAGETNENRLGGAALGAAAGGAGNVVGRAAATTLGGLISPSGGKLAPLYEMGVRPSIGQRLGGFANVAEEKFQSIPLIGDAIKGTRDRARDQFQIGLFNDALGEIGQQIPKGMRPGHDPHAFAQKAFKSAYDNAELGMTAAADAQLGVDLGALQRTVAGLRPESQRAFDTLWKGSVARRFAGGSLSGESYKSAMSELSRKAAAVRANKTGDSELADALEEAMSAIRGSATRNSPPESVAALDAADRGYAKLVRIEEASRKAGGEPAEFSPTQYNTAVKTASGGTRNRGYLAGNALNSDIAALGTQLGDKVSNSGTIDRLLATMAVGGAGYVNPTAAAVLSGIGALNLPGARVLTTAAMAPRGGKAKTLADLIRKKSAIAGTLGSSLGIGLLPSN